MNLRRIGLAAALLALVSGAAAEPRSIPISAEQRQALGIETAALAAADVFFGKTLPAEVVIPPTQLRLISAPQAGLVSRVRVAAGDEVRRGETVAELQSPELAALQREFLQALTRLRLAAGELERDRTLFEEGIIAKRRYLETQGRHEELAAALEEHRQTLLLAGLSTEDVAVLRRERRLGAVLPIRSPIDGVVLDSQVEIGQRVEVATALFRVARLDPLWLQVRAPLEVAGKLRPGDPVRVPATGAAGHLVTIGAHVDAASQTVRLRAQVSAGADLLRPGQYVEVTVGAAGDGSVRFRVPSAAVARSGERTVLFVADETGFTPYPVQVIASSEHDSVVTGDLPAQARVAVSGIAAIKGAWMGLGGGE